MKKAKRLVSLLLAFVVLMSLAIGVGAAGDTDLGTMEGPTEYAGAGKISIFNAVEGETYSAYQLFYLASYKVGSDATTDADGNKIGGNYAYKITNSWLGLLSYEGVSQYIKTDKDGYIEWVGQSSKERAGEFAKLAIAYRELHKDDIKPVAKVTATKNSTSNEVEAVMDNLNLGYYLVDTTLGSLCSLDTTNPDVYMQEKNVVPENDKKVYENEWGKNNDASIGDTVEFRSLVRLHNGDVNIKLHDKMCDALDLVVDSTNIVDTVKIYIGSDKKEENRITSDKYDVYINDINITGQTIPDGEFSGDCANDTFHVVFKQSYLDSIPTATTIDLYVFYNAKLNANAAVAGEGNRNDCKLSYGDNNHYTPGDYTVTKTWQLPVHKYTLTGSDNSTRVSIAGAKFQLFKTILPKETPKTESDPIQFVKNSTDGEYSVTVNGVTTKYSCPSYHVATEDEITDSTITKLTDIETSATGNFILTGLDSGTYALKETYAPEPYKLLVDPIPVEIKSDGSINQNNSSIPFIDVFNGTGTELPSTGGIGTTIFYVAGSILLIGAAVLLIVKKRMSNEK